jgi:hypothetical protein
MSVPGFLRDNGDITQLPLRPIEICAQALVGMCHVSAAVAGLLSLMRIVSANTVAVVALTTQVWCVCRFVLLTCVH